MPYEWAVFYGCDRMKLRLAAIASPSHPRRATSASASKRGDQQAARFRNHRTTSSELSRQAHLGSKVGTQPAPNQQEVGEVCSAILIHIARTPGIETGSRLRPTPPANEGVDIVVVHDAIEVQVAHHSELRARPGQGEGGTTCTRHAEGVLPRVEVIEIQVLDVVFFAIARLQISAELVIGCLEQIETQVGDRGIEGSETVAVKAVGHQAVPGERHRQFVEVTHALGDRKKVEMLVFRGAGHKIPANQIDLRVELADCSGLATMW